MSVKAERLSVALLWRGAVIQEETYGMASDAVVTVGEDQKNNFIVISEGISEDFNMFERTSDGYVFRYTDKLSGDITRDGQDLVLGDEGLSAMHEGGVSEVVLQPGDRGLIRVSENNQIFFHLFDQMPVVPMRGLLSATTDMNAMLSGLIFVSAMAHMLFLVLAFLSYDPSAKLDPLYAQNKFASFMVNDIKEQVEEDDEKPSEEDSGKRAEGEEGKVGVEDTEVEETKLTKVDGEMAKEIDIRNIGVNKALGSKLLGGGPLKNIFGNQEGFANDINVAMDGGDGTMQVGRGQNGMGLRGLGSGGGGKDGMGRIGAIGSVDTGGGKGKGANLKRGAKKKPKSQVRVATPKLNGFCEKSNIQRVVRAKKNAVRHCFEKELQTNPKLSGKIVSMWQVGLDGKVKSANIASSTMGNKSVEGCLVRVIKRMRFAKPKGGLCVINYPFIFSGLD